MRLRLTALLIGTLAANLAHATVVSSGAGGFAIHQEFTTKLEPAAAWQRLVRVGDWWSSDHTYSGKASNLSLELKPGGCWCEKLVHGGFVRHMDVIFASAPKLLRVAGGLGPLQGMGASGTLSFNLKPEAGGGTKLVVDYVVAGYAAGGFTEIAAAVDEVLGEQLARYAAP